MLILVDLFMLFSYESYRGSIAGQLADNPTRSIAFCLFGIMKHSG